MNILIQRRKFSITLYQRGLKPQLQAKIPMTLFQVIESKPGTQMTKSLPILKSD